MPRTITLHFEEDEIDRSSLFLASQGAKDPRKLIQDLIGYLAMWNTSYPVLDVYALTSTAEFQAVYRYQPFKPGDSPDYVIVGIYDRTDERYNTHS